MGRYLTVLPVPAFRSGPGTFEIESAFAEHLRMLRSRLGSLASPLVLALPEFSAEDRARLGRLALDASRQLRLTAEVLQAAIGCVAAGQPLGNAQLLGCRPSERALRFGLERSYRSLARLEPDPARRGSLVDLANEVRPRTWS